MARKQVRVSKLTLFVCLCLSGVILLLLPQRITNKLNFTFIEVFNFFLNVGIEPDRYAASGPVGGDFVSRHTYNQLWVAYSNLQAELFEQRKRAEKLSQMRIIEPNPSTGFVLAEVINSRNTELIINRGRDNGIRKGQYVLGDNSVIGIISDVSDTVAVVKLITDAACRLYVRIAAAEVDSYINATMQGTGGNTAKILNLARKYKIKTGYKVYAAGKPGKLQSPRIIGRISACRVDEDNPLLWDIDVEPAYDFKNISEVAVIVIKTEKD